MQGYSIAIRTLGTAGVKYKLLLESIKKAAIQPEKVVVVLPFGYALPEDRLGCEEFVFCRKSMIVQRLEALKHIDSAYTLFLDDDIAFEPDFVEKLLRPLESGEYDCSTGPLFSFFPRSTAGAIAGTLTGSVSVSLFNRDKYVKILRSGGWSYHRFDTSKERLYPTESFAWTCFCIKTDVMRKIDMEDEIVWIEKNQYAYGDDRVMAYKLVKRGYKACVVANALYTHNDGRTSTSKEEIDYSKQFFCRGFFQIVFWDRYIRKLESSGLLQMIDRFCINYWILGMLVYHLLKSLLNGKHWKNTKEFYKGVKEGFKYTLSDEYLELPSVCP